MLQQDEPDEYVIATGATHSVRELLETAFAQVGLHYEDYVYVDQKFVRPADVEILLGDPSKAKEKLGWEPQVTFETLIQMMVESDLAALRKRGC